VQADHDDALAQVVVGDLLALLGERVELLAAPRTVEPVA